MKKTKLPPESNRIDAIQLFRVLRSLSAFIRGVDVYDWEAGETAAMILLGRLGLAAPIRDEVDEDEDGNEVGSWVLTVEGNERLADLLTELRQWDPDRPTRMAHRRRVERAERMASRS